jgi:hypothetical protein
MALRGPCSLAPLLVLVIAWFGAESAPAQTVPDACPIVIENTTLKADCTGPMIIAGDDLNVNLGTHRVICPDRATSGIVVYQRLRVHVENGHVHGCSVGIDVRNAQAAPSSHKFMNLHVDDNEIGISMFLAGDNEIVSSTVVGNKVAGVHLFQSDGTRIDSGTLVANPVNIDMVQTSGTEIGSSTIGPGVVGIRMKADHGASIHGNSIVGNSQFGISFSLSAHLNVVQGNEIAHNGKGIRGLSSQANFVIGNTIHDNAQEGILIGLQFDARWQVHGNHVIRNGTGIRVEAGSLANTIEFNTARENAVFDLADDNPNCDANVWRNNNHDTENQPCID